MRPPLQSLSAAKGREVWFVGQGQGEVRRLRGCKAK